MDITASSTKLDSLNYTNKSNEHFCFQKLDDLRRSGQLCDVVLTGSSSKRAEAESCHVFAHRCVLAAACPYFYALFIGNGTIEEVAINEIESEVLPLLVDYFYTSSIRITTHNYQAILTAAVFLQLKELEAGCAEFIRSSQPRLNGSRSLVSKIVTVNDHTSKGNIPEALAKPMPAAANIVPSSIRLVPANVTITSGDDLPLIDLNSSSSASSARHSSARSPSPCPSEEDGSLKVPHYDLMPHGNFECEVSYVQSPSHFWIRARPCTAEVIEAELLDRLRQLPYAEQILERPLIGQYCSAPYQDDHRRGRILDLKVDSSGQKFAKILYIDHGSHAWISTDALCILPAVSYYYQWQSVLCRLYGVEPSGDCWPQEVVEKFKELCSSNNLYLSSLDSEVPRNHAYTVKLFQPSATGRNLEETAATAGDKTDSDERIDTLLLAGCNNRSIITSTSFPVGRFSAPHSNNGTSFGRFETWQIKFNYSRLAQAQQQLAKQEPDGNDLSEMGSLDLEQRAHASNRELVNSSTVRQPVIKRCFNIAVVDYKQYLDQNEFLHLKVTSVSSPDSFHVTPLHSDPLLIRKEAQEFTRFTNELTSFYSEIKNCIPIDYSTLNSLPYAVARLDEFDGGTSFFRCKVVEKVADAPPPGVAPSALNDPSTTFDIRLTLRLRVYFVDLDREESPKAATEVYLLDERFGHYPSRVLKCCLFATRPITEGTSSSFSKWSPDAIEAFRNFISVTETTKATVLLNEGDRLGVALYSKDKNNRHFVVNHELVRLNMARSDVQWVSFVTDKLDTLNSLCASNIDPVASEEQFHARFVQSAVFSAAGASNAVDVSDLNPSTYQYISIPVVGSLLKVVVNSIPSCIRFCVIFPHGTIDIRRKRYELQLQEQSSMPVVAYEEYKNKINSVTYTKRLQKFLLPPRINDYCLARFREDGKLYRAKIIQFNDEDQDFQVKFVDYGNIDWVNINHLYKINSKDLLAVPFMSLECLLADLKPNPATESTENINSLWEVLNGRVQTIRIMNVLKGNDDAPRLSVELKVQDADGSYINVNELVVRNNWALQK